VEGGSIHEESQSFTFNQIHLFCTRHEENLKSIQPSSVHSIGQWDERRDTYFTLVWYVRAKERVESKPRIQITNACLRGKLVQPCLPLYNPFSRERT